MITPRADFRGCIGVHGGQGNGREREGKLRSVLGHAERRARRHVGRDPRRDEFRLRRCRGSLDVGPVARVLAVDGEVLVFGQRALVGRVDVRVARLAPREPRGDARGAADAAAVQAGAAGVAAARLDEVGGGARREVLEALVLADPLEPELARRALLPAAAKAPDALLAGPDQELLRVRGLHLAVAGDRERDTGRD